MVLLLATVGIVGCVAGGIGIWTFCRKASERVEKISARLDVGLQRVSAANQQIQRAVAKARADLAEVSKESAKPREGGAKSRRTSRAVRTLIQKQVGPNLDNLGGRLDTLSDTAVAVSSLLQSFQELPNSRSGRLQPEQAERWADQAQQLSATLRQLEAVVGDGEKESSGREVADATSAVDRVLEKCQAMVDDWQSELDAAGEELSEVKAEILGWLKLTAIAVTLLCAWIGAGQISLFAHALHWCCGR
jgi:hypothetical protein